MATLREIILGRQRAGANTLRDEQIWGVPEIAKRPVGLEQSK